MNESLYILGGKRTPMAEYSGSSRGGAFKDHSAVDLGTISAKETLKQTNVQPEWIDHVVFGNVIQSSPDAVYGARHVGLRSGIPQHVPALTVNRLCGSGIQSIISGAHEIQLEDADCVLAGGMENMSQAPHVIPGARDGLSFGNPPQIQDWLMAGLRDSYCGEFMAETSDNLAREYNISRNEQDEFAYRSHQRGAEAVQNGVFDEEIVPVSIGPGEDEQFKRDDHIKPDTTLEKLSSLSSSFGPDSFVTPGNASGIVDGAASVTVCSDSFAQTHGLEPEAEILNWSTVGVDPSRMGLGPAHAIPAVLESTAHNMDDIDLFEINEAFAGQYLAVEKELGLNRDRVNVNGGAIALGHPLGMTGTRLVLTLIRELHRQDQQLGIASACIGGGQGIAMLVKRTS